MSVPPLTTVIAVTWRGAAHITDCLDALAKQNRPHRTLVVDNASQDGTVRLLAEHPSAPRVLRLHRNLGYAGALDAALSLVDTPFVAWLNDDAVPARDWLDRLEEALMATPGAAAAGSRLERADGTPQSLGVRLTVDGHGADLPDGAPEVFGFCGGAVLLRTEALRAVGGVPAGFFCYYEDTDTAWRLRLAGWQVITVPDARVRHLHGVSTKPGSVQFHLWNERNRLLMLLRCAPAAVAAWELARFVALTVLLATRRQRPAAANFQVRLRCRVLADVIARVPSTLAARWAIGRRSMVARGQVWRYWAGH